MVFIQHHILVHSVYKYANRFNTVSGFEEAKNLIKTNRIKSEQIGHWLYCFTNQLIGAQLLATGFWYSFKHSAYVFSGKPKEGPAGDETLNELRARHGSFPVQTMEASYV